jgi:hypothetical protein
MKTRVVVTWLVAVCSNLVGQTTHWENIKELTGAYEAARTLERSQAAAAALRAYLETLTAEELIVAARAYSEEVQTREPHDLWIGAAMGLRFFWIHYPKVTNDVESIQPLLNDMADGRQPVFWRWVLCQLMCDWRDRLEMGQSLEASTTMLQIFADRNEPFELRAQAVGTSSLLLASAYTEALKNDPNVKAFLAGEVNGTDFITAVHEERVTPTSETMKLASEIRAAVFTHIAEQRKLFIEAAEPVELRAEIVKAWIRYGERQIAGPEVKSMLRDAALRYAKYDEKLWPVLVEANLWTFKNENMRSQLQLMIENATDERVKRQLKNQDIVLRNRKQ